MSRLLDASRVQHITMKKLQAECDERKKTLHPHNLIYWKERVLHIDLHAQDMTIKTDASTLKFTLHNISPLHSLEYRQGEGADARGCTPRFHLRTCHMQIDRGSRVRRQNISPIIAPKIQPFLSDVCCVWKSALSEMRGIFTREWKKESAEAGKEARGKVSPSEKTAEEIEWEGKRHFLFLAFWK